MKTIWKQGRFVITIGFILAEVLYLFCLRKFYLLTVFQTVAAYAAVCLIGIFCRWLSLERGV